MKQQLGTYIPMQIGGQAVLEGVMMRAPGMVATAVRKPDGMIVIHREPHVSLVERITLLKLPVLRGAVGLLEMMVIGIRTLNLSAEIALQQGNGAPKGNGHPKGNGGPKKNGSALGEVGSTQARRNKMALWVTLVAALVAGIAIFFVTPLLITMLLFNIQQEPLWFNMIAGLVRIGLFLGYLLIISQLKDVKRLFEYHGAEHKAVFAHERGGEVTVQSAMAQSRFHPRCGTSFVLVVLLIAIVLYALIDTLLLGLLGSLTLGVRLLAHLLLLPLIGGVSYEFLKLSAKRSVGVLGKLVVAPGLWLQRITTREPDEKQVHVALVALQSALGEEPTLEGAPVHLYQLSLN